jgi:predicted nucleic acid-binding protein
MFSPLFMRSRIKIGSTPEEHENALALLNVVFRIMDRVTTLQMTNAERTRAEKNRRTIMALKNKDKEEEKEEAKAQKKREEEEAYQARLKKMTPEERRKAEDKRRQQDLKKQKNKMTKKTK